MSSADERIITVEEAQAILEEKVRPAIRGHAGDVHVVKVSEQGDVTVEFSGSCTACPLRPVTFGTAILPAFEGVAGIREVLCQSVRVSPHAMRRMAQMFGTALQDSRENA
jgi:Fe-S cluster biogenesis protein NfuA